MRNLNEGGKKRKTWVMGWEKITEIVTAITLASRLPDIALTATMLLVPIISIFNAKMKRCRWITVLLTAE